MGFSAAVFAGLQLFAGVTKSILQIGEGEARAQAQEYAASSDLFNMDIARQEARLSQARVKLKLGRARKAQERLVSEQQVLFAKSGVRIDVGTPLIVMQDTLEETELDMLIMQFNTDVESARLESEARQSEISAAQRRGAAKQERTAGRMRAGTTLLETAGSFAQKFPQKSSKMTIGGRGGKVMQTKKFGKVWSPYK